MKQENNIEEVLTQIGELAPSEQENPIAARTMLNRIRAEVGHAQPRVSLADRITQWLFAPSRRAVVTAVTLLFIFSVGFTFPTVRAAASDFLGNFRVQKFAAISISPDQLAVLEQVAESGLRPGEIQFVEEPGEATAVDSLREASRRTGMRPLLTLPQLGEPSEILVTDGGSAIFTINLEESRAILELAGADPNLLPQELNNRDVRIFMFNGVGQRWVDGTMLLQTESPIVEYPGGIDPAPLGEALLQLLGLSNVEAARLARQIDWTSTLVLPVPTDVGTFQEVTVQGVSGLYLNAVNQGESALVWQKNGMLYMLGGSGNVDALLDIVNGLR